MKKQILTLIIGILIGAIITTGVFLMIKSNEKNNMPDMSNRTFERRERGNRSTTEDTKEVIEESNEEKASE